MGGTGDMAGLAVLQGQARHGMLGERVAIPQMKRTCPVGSGQVPVDQGLSSRTFLKNCFLFHLILHLKVLSVVRYILPFYVLGYEPQGELMMICKVRTTTPYSKYNILCSILVDIWTK